jgi:hypothetical protein
LSIEKVVSQFVSLVRPPWWSAGPKRKAARAAKALAALEQDIPWFGGFLFANVRRALEDIVRSKGPDPRISFLDWICVSRARALVEEFSQKQPVTSQNGNVHMIAQFLHEAATGERGSEAGLLKAVKKYSTGKLIH